MNKKTLLAILLIVALALLFPVAASSQSRIALVIGNGNYIALSKLKNPVNDARDLGEALKNLGFQVEVLTDADLTAMEDAVVQLGNRLSHARDSIGFFFYAGHGVQSGGTNYLIPADARIANDSFLKTKALSAQSVLDTLQGTRNENGVNVVVLDACRDNPFSWSRSGSRGLSVVGSQPPGSIIAYATSAGSVAKDGEGRNGVFTAELLNHLRVPGLEIKEVFNRTGAAVRDLTNGKQVPAVYSQFFSNVYLAGAPQSAQTQMRATPLRLSISRIFGSLSITTAITGALYLDGQYIGELPAGSRATLNDVETGDRSLEMRYKDGNIEHLTANVEEGKVVGAAFSYRPAINPSTQPASATIRRIYTIGETGPAGGIVFYDKGSYSDGWRYLEAAPKDQSTGVMWSSWKNTSTGASGTAIGTGQANTRAIVIAQGDGNYAAIICAALSLGGFDNWFLPSKDELSLMFKNLKKVPNGGFAADWYWSSTEYNIGDAWEQAFDTGFQNCYDKSTIGRVRAVRAF